MSHILFQGSNLVVTGELWGEYANIPLEDGVKAPKGNIRRTLFLTFIVQMNGKMIVHKETYCLIPDYTSSENPVLEDWTVWYTTINLFSSFWYLLSEDRNQIYNSWWIIRNWIDQLIIEENRAIWQGNIVWVEK